MQCSASQVLGEHYLDLDEFDEEFDDEELEDIKPPPEVACACKQKHTQH